jgi:hypothetical protein
MESELTEREQVGLLSLHHVLHRRNRIPMKTFELIVRRRMSDFFDSKKLVSEGPILELGFEYDIEADDEFVAVTRDRWAGVIYGGKSSASKLDSKASEYSSKHESEIVSKLRSRFNSLESDVNECVEEIEEELSALRQYILLGDQTLGKTYPEFEKAEIYSPLCLADAIIHAEFDTIEEDVASIDTLIEVRGEDFDFLLRLCRALDRLLVPVAERSWLQVTRKKAEPEMWDKGGYLPSLAIFRCIKLLERVLQHGMNGDKDTLLIEGLMARCLHIKARLALQKKGEEIFGEIGGISNIDLAKESLSDAMDKILKDESGRHNDLFHRIKADMLICREITEETGSSAERVKGWEEILSSSSGYNSRAAKWNLIYYHEEGEEKIENLKTELENTGSDWERALLSLWIGMGILENQNSLKALELSEVKNLRENEMLAHSEALPFLTEAVSTFRNACPVRYEFALDSLDTTLIGLGLLKQSTEDSGYGITAALSFAPLISPSNILNNIPEETGGPIIYDLIDRRLEKQEALTSIENLRARNSQEIDLTMLDMIEHMGGYGKTEGSKISDATYIEEIKRLEGIYKGTEYWEKICNFTFIMRVELLSRGVKPERVPNIPEKGVISGENEFWFKALKEVISRGFESFREVTPSEEAPEIGSSPILSILEEIIYPERVILRYPEDRQDLTEKGEASWHAKRAFALSYYALALDCHGTGSIKQDLLDGSEDSLRKLPTEEEGYKRFPEWKETVHPGGGGKYNFVANPPHQEFVKFCILRFSMDWMNAKGEFIPEKIDEISGVVHFDSEYFSEHAKFIAGQAILHKFTSGGAKEGGELDRAMELFSQIGDSHISFGESCYNRIICMSYKFLLYNNQEIADESLIGELGADVINIISEIEGLFEKIEPEWRVHICTAARFAELLSLSFVHNQYLLSLESGIDVDEVDEIVSEVSDGGLEFADLPIVVFTRIMLIQISLRRMVSPETLDMAALEEAGFEIPGPSEIDELNYNQQRTIWKQLAITELISLGFAEEYPDLTPAEEDDPKDRLSNIFEEILRGGQGFRPDIDYILGCYIFFRMAKERVDFGIDEDLLGAMDRFISDSVKIYDMTPRTALELDMAINGLKVLFSGFHLSHLGGFLEDAEEFLKGNISPSDRV